MSQIKLYDYFRSSASYRVRIALNFKNLEYELQEIHLVNNGGEQHSLEYKNFNPQGLVPTLIDNGFKITQSLAILEYLEEVYPKPNLLPTDAPSRAIIRSICNIISCDTHPLNNLRVLNYLTNNLAVTSEQKLTWYQHWINLSFTALEQLLSQYHGNFCYGNNVSLADLCLIPQIYNAARFNCDLSKYPIINKINNNCLELQAFKLAAPNCPN